MVDDFNILGKNSVRPVGLRSAELQCSCGSPPGIADKPIILPFKRDAAKGPSIYAPWQTERISCTRLNWPNKRRDMTVRLSENARLLPYSVPAQGGSEAQVQPFTWIGRTRDKMAEVSLAE